MKTLMFGGGADAGLYGKQATMFDNGDCGTPISSRANAVLLNALCVPSYFVNVNELSTGFLSRTMNVLQAQAVVGRSVTALSRRDKRKGDVDVRRGRLPYTQACRAKCVLKTA
jgi:hypothetical protein